MILSLILPNEYLLPEVKGALRKMRPIVQQNKGKLNAAIGKIHLYLVYDLLNAFALDYVWQLKKQA